MPLRCASLRGSALAYAILFWLLLLGRISFGQNSAPASNGAAPASNRATYNRAIFQNPMAPAQLAFLTSFAGRPSNDLIRDRQFRKLMKEFVPNCTFHYGSDMSINDALDMVIKGSKDPVQIFDNRYLVLSGENGPYLSGRGFLWIDLKEGLGLGAFFFQPVNGEPTPSLNVFSRQIKEDALMLGELPPVFAEVLSQWSRQARVPIVTTRYFLSGANKKILLEHDEDFCTSPDGITAPPGDVCERVSAEAAEFDMDAAIYLEQVHHATNATAWMITGQDQVAWLRIRDNTCGIGPNPLSCRVRFTRERTHSIIRRPMPPPHPHR